MNFNSHVTAGWASPRQVVQPLRTLSEAAFWLESTNKAKAVNVYESTSYYCSISQTPPPHEGRASAALTQLRIIRPS